MKIKVLLLALGCTMGTLGAYAQKGVDNGTQFGSGEDSVRCITNISLFVPYAKAGNFKDAYDFWKIVYCRYKRYLFVRCENYGLEDRPRERSR